MLKNREISALKLGAASSDRRERTTQENGDYMSIRKIPKWEVEEFTPQDRKYDYSSYAIDQEEKEKVINKVGLLDVKGLKKGRIYSYKELCQLIGDKPQTNPDQKYNQQQGTVAGNGRNTGLLCEGGRLCCLCCHEETTSQMVCCCRHGSHASIEYSASKS